MSYTRFDSQATRTSVSLLIGHSYQRNVLFGGEAWSGSTLTGTAKKYGGRYRDSRQNLIDRLEREGFTVEFVLEDRRKIGVIGCGTVDVDARHAAWQRREAERKAAEAAAQAEEARERAETQARLEAAEAERKRKAAEDAAISADMGAIERFVA